MSDGIALDQNEEQWTLKDGRQVLIRSIRAEDESAIARFHQTLSPESVYTRYFNTFKLSQRITHERLDRVCHPEAIGDIVLVVIFSAAAEKAEIVAVGRLSVSAAGTTGELSLVVSDAYQRQGIGGELLHRLIRIARRNGLSHLVARMLAGNLPMRRLCLLAGMHISESMRDGDLVANLNLAAARPIV